MKPTIDYIDTLWINYCRNYGEKPGIRAILKDIADHIIQDDDLGSALDVARMLYCAIDEKLPVETEPVYHVHFYFDTAPYVLHCTHCGAKQEVPVPLLLDDLMVAARKFDRAHRGCQKPAVAV